MYAKTTVNIRDYPNVHCKIVGKFKWNDTIEIVRRVNKKWYQVNYKNKLKYICAKYVKKKKTKYKSYDASEFKKTSGFKSFEDGNNITNNTKLAQGKLKQKYHLDSKTGIYMVDDRYCIAVGSYYSKKVGTKIDLVLSYKGKTHVLKCIMADGKADRHTTNNHRIHISDGSMVEFVVSKKALSKKTRMMGNISYAGKAFKGYIKTIRVYENK